MLDIIAPPRPGLDLRQHYGHWQSPAVRAGGFVFCSGLLPVDAETGERRHGTLTEEAHVIFANLKLLLAAAGSSLDHLVQAHALIYDSIEYAVLNRIYRQYVGAAPPARTVWDARSEAGFKVQLDVTAAAPDALAGNAGPALREALAPPANDALASAAVRGGDFVFVSGLTAADAVTGGPVPQTTAEQTALVLDHMQRVLKEAGSSLRQVVKVNVLLHSMLEAPNMNEVYACFFPDPPPARTVCGARLPPGIKVMIECTALGATR